jgi:hypothetical protein
MSNIQGSVLVAPLARRTTGGFALSIGTSLAFESLFEARQAPYDADREIPQRIDVRHYNEIWINLATLYRNIIGSLEDKNDYAKLSPWDLAHAVVFEIEMIMSLMQNEGHGLCQPIFYYADYKSLYKRQFPSAVRFREDKTDAQRHNTYMLTKTMAMLFDNINGGEVHHLDSELIPKKPSNAIILSHMPYDLLSYGNFKRLELLESHTGKLKGRNLWYSKYHSVGQEQLNTLPFIRQFLFLFGDHVMFQPTDIRFRKLLVEISRTRRWTPLTSEAKIRLDLDVELKERYLFELYKQL